VRYEYAPEALDVLVGHGLQPGPDTPPAVVRAALSDLYRYEIRRLKRRLLAGDVAMAQYSDHVIGLRKQYWLLSIPVQRWVRETPEPTPSTPQDIIG
jgi:hypothetical protein